MLKEQRHQILLAQLQKERTLTIAQASLELNVSYMTIWRDLVELENKGLLRRVRGGAICAPPESPKAPYFPNFDPRNDPHYEHKQAIGRYAATHLIDDGDSLIIEAGTTATAIVPALRRSNLTLLTNGLVTAYLASQHLPQNSVLCSGGILINTGAFIGPQAEAFFTHLRVKKAFFGAAGVTPQDGFTDPIPLYSNLKRAMKANAEQIIMLVDSSKLGVRSLVQVMPLNEVHILVTDADANPAIVDELRRCGLDVRLAE